MAPREIKEFRKTVWRFYKKHGRHDLPWRKTRDPYKILVSEVMLQQTQVERVRAFYAGFMKRYPTPERLASAPLASVLRSWQGLGYNRRAKLLHEAARVLSMRRSDLRNSKRSDLVMQVAELEELPGIGPYTARAIAAFAFNQDVVMIETNIRTAIIHHFFSKRKKVTDKEIEEVLVRASPDFAKASSGTWYWALMDYGAYLKRSGVKLNVKQARHAKQKKFAGSNREARGAILRALASVPQGDSSPRGVTLRGDSLTNLLGPSRRTQLRTALAALESEGLIERRGRTYSLAG